jgi:hypothetical protein
VIARGKETASSRRRGPAGETWFPPRWIHVFGLADGNIRRVVSGERVGTIIDTPSREG